MQCPLQDSFKSLSQQTQSDSISNCLWIPKCVCLGKINYRQHSSGFRDTTPYAPSTEGKTRVHGSKIGYEQGIRPSGVEISGKSNAEDGLPSKMGNSHDGMYLHSFLFYFDQWCSPWLHKTLARITPRWPTITIFIFAVCRGPTFTDS